jgi:hypothetical protein
MTFSGLMAAFTKELPIKPPTPYEEVLLNCSTAVAGLALGFLAGIEVTVGLGCSYWIIYCC